MTPHTPDSPLDLATMRREYGDRPLDESDLAPHWVIQFAKWFAEATDLELVEPNAMVLATADRTGRPSARTVLLKAYDERGFTFFTNYESAKGGELAENPYASLVFPWYALHRQVLVRGSVDRVTREETEEYFATRPRGAQLGAWASPQSRVLADRAELENAWSAAEDRFPDGVSAPPHWGGFRVTPERVEFWQGRSSRLHDRLRYHVADGGWRVERLAP